MEPDEARYRHQRDVALESSFQQPSQGTSEPVIRNQTLFFLITSSQPWPTNRADFVDMMYLLTETRERAMNSSGADGVSNLTGIAC
jgi:hypothetical protein